MKMVKSRQRQREKTRQRLEDSRSLWAFQVLLIIFIFFTWLIWTRIFSLFGLTTSHCVEQAATFGNFNKLPEIYTLLSHLVVLMAIFWVTITVSFWRAFRHWMTYGIHLALLISLFFLFSEFRTMRLGEGLSPDGTLTVQRMIMDSAVSPPQFFPYPDRYADKGHWKFVESRNKILDQGGYYLPECVWLDRNLITQNWSRDIPGYAAASTDEKEKLSREMEYYNIDWDDLSFLNMFKISVKSSFGKLSLAELLQAQQSYRPLSAEERARFLRKKDCLKNQIYTTGHNQKCQYVWIPEWEGQ